MRGYLVGSFSVLAGILGAALTLAIVPAYGGYNPTPLSAALGGTGFDGSAAGNGKLPIGNGTGFTLANLTGTLGIVGITNGSGTITLGPAGVDANNLGGEIVIRTPITAVASNGTDVTIYSSNAPYGMNVCDAWVDITTGVASTVATLRNATAGGGSALTSAISMASTGVIRNNLTTTAVNIAANGTIVWRISGGAGSNVTGVAYVALQKQ